MVRLWSKAFGYIYHILSFGSIKTLANAFLGTQENINVQSYKIVYKTRIYEYPLKESFVSKKKGKKKKEKKKYMAPFGGAKSS